MRVPRSIFVLFAASLIGLAACRKSTTANWDVDAVAPVLNSVLNIKNFIPDSLFTTDNTGLLHLTLNREVANLKLDSVFNIPSTDTTLQFRSFFETVLQPGQAIPVPSSEIKLDFPNGASISTLKVHSGFLKVVFSNTVDRPLDIAYELPTVLKDGKTFKITETIPSGNKSLSRSYDLSGYSFSLRGLTGKVYNTLAQTISLSLSQSTSSTVIKYNQGADVTISYVNFVPDFVEGYFGQQVVDIANDTTDIAFLQNLKAQNFLLSEASMEFNIVNELGVDFSGSISNVKAINSKQNKVVTLSSNQLASITLDRATRLNTNRTSKNRLLKFNASNSNIAAFISALPDKLSFQGTVKMNQIEPGNISNYHDFAFYGTGVRILANIDIPLKFKADYFELQTESKFEFTGAKALEGVNSGAFVVKGSNGFPFTAQVQAYMYDANNVLIDSVFVAGQNMLKSGLVNSANEVTAVQNSEMRIPVTRAKLDNLVRCKKMKIVSRLLMPPNPPDIKILEKYEIGINIIAEVNYNVDLGR